MLLIFITIFYLILIIILRSTRCCPYGRFQYYKPSADTGTDSEISNLEFKFFVDSLALFGMKLRDQSDNNIGEHSLMESRKFEH